MTVLSSLFYSASCRVFSLALLPLIVDNKTPHKPMGHLGYFSFFVGVAQFPSPLLPYDKNISDYVSININIQIKHVTHVKFLGLP